MSYIYICYMICVHYKSIQVVRIRFLPSGPSAVHALAARAPRLQVPEAQSKALENTESEETRWEVPCDLRRSVCPISGERFDRTWSSTLNDWAFTDAAAAEMHATKPLRFPPGGPLGPHGLSETAVVFKKSCFLNTSLTRRIDALHECRDPDSVKKPAKPVTGSQQAVEVAPSSGKEDFATVKAPPARKFF
ncbi:unnamed protein product [Durusdinium trenchii]|uniref:Uncharacterized protein n=1 Tax=Durusdinium trenchii TaxID=1381693 RepID=A0ABP0KYC0_9DINO